MADNAEVVVDDTGRGHVPRTVAVARVRRFTPEGIADIAAVVDVTTRPYEPRIVDAVRIRRHLFISSDIRIKAFTFNQN